MCSTTAEYISVVLFLELNLKINGNFTSLQKSIFHVARSDLHLVLHAVKIQLVLQQLSTV